MGDAENVPCLHGCIFHTLADWLQKCPAACNTINWSPKLEVTKHTVGIIISVIHSSHVSTVWNCSVSYCSDTMCPIYRMVYGYPSVTAFYIFCQQICLTEFFEMCCAGSAFSLQNSMYFIMLPFLVHNIFTFCIYLQKFKCPNLLPKGCVCVCVCVCIC